MLGGDNTQASGIDLATGRMIVTEQFHKPEIGLASFKDTAMFYILKDSSYLLLLNGSFLENIF